MSGVVASLVRGELLECGAGQMESILNRGEGEESCRPRPAVVRNGVHPLVLTGRRPPAATTLPPPRPVPPSPPDGEEAEEYGIRQQQEKNEKMNRK